MAGILNNKERIIDFLVTKEGRRQAASGQLMIRYATFTDYHTFYQASGSNGVAEDATDRIFFEATSRYQDVVVPELEPGTTSISRPFRTEDFSLHGKNIASGTFRSGVSELSDVILTGSELAAGTGRMLDGITKNFNELRITGTTDHFSLTQGFRLSSPLTGTFRLTDNTRYNEAPAGPDGTSGTETIHLDTSLSLFQDSKVSHLPNFSYLPPVNVSNSREAAGDPLGIYPKLNDNPIMDFNDLQKHLEKKEFKDIYFDETSRENNLIMQLFEFSDNDIEKLSIIDFGNFPDNDPFSPDKRVYFVGKIRRDSTGADTFLNIFTVVFD